MNITSFSNPPPARRETSQRALMARLAGFSLLLWAGYWLYVAFDLSATQHRCVSLMGPFGRCGPGPNAWLSPFLIGLAPLTSLGLWHALRCTFRRQPD